MTILVTGATDGIGYAAARQLGARGHRVLVHGRTRDKAARAAAALAAATGRDAFVPVAADFGSLDEVRALAAEVAARHAPLDVLLNNAGIYARKRQLSSDGWELTLAVNHLAPFALTHLLLPALAASGHGRVVVVSSMAHGSGRIDFDDLDGERGWDGYSAYAASKLANLLFTYELARRLEGRPVTVNALHPGVIGTKLLRKGFGSLGGADAERGAAGEVMLATDPALDGVSGRYYDETDESRSSRASHDRLAQARLYQVSLERTGVTAA